VRSRPELAALPRLGTFDLVLSIGTLQSPASTIERSCAASSSITSRHRRRDLRFPNCRYLDGELQFGARTKNLRQPELGLVVKDVAFYRKYLQQHHRRVFVTGKHYLLVTGIPERGEAPITARLLDLGSP